MKRRILESNIREDPSLKDDSSLNPLIDRRSGEDRRKANNPDFLPAAVSKEEAALNLD
jgi:hypothetical protein